MRLARAIALTVRRTPGWIEFALIIGLWALYLYGWHSLRS